MALRRLNPMKYRGIEYTVVQGIGRHMWEWSTSVAGVMVMGRAHTNAAASAAAEKAIDKALGRQKGAACSARKVMKWIAVPSGQGGASPFRPCGGSARRIGDSERVRHHRKRPQRNGGPRRGRLLGQCAPGARRTDNNSGCKRSFLALPEHQWPRYATLRSPDGGEELDHLGLEALVFVRQQLRRRKHLR
jgi:hypothetical protein